MAKFEVEFTTAAENELIEAINWYEEQQPNLGQRFYNRVKDIINLLSTDPYLFQVRKSRLRAAFLNPFPYLLIYDVSENQFKVTIYVVHHMMKRNDW